jgi:uncharacterized membrane protein YeiH
MTLPALPPLSDALILIEVVSTLAFACSGLLAGARNRLDAVGVAVVTGLAAFGGGTLRDILLDRRPFFWVAHVNWLWVLLVLCGVAMLFLRARHLAVTERAMQWPDALGLGLFSAAGTQIALDAQWPALTAVLMGVVTATFGGVLRDVVCAKIPSAFSDHRPYAICAFVGSWGLVLAPTLGGPSWLGLALGAGTTITLRVLALWSNYQLPVWQFDEKPPSGP